MSPKPSGFEPAAVGGGCVGGWWRLESGRLLAFGMSQSLDVVHWAMGLSGPVCWAQTGTEQGLVRDLPICRSCRRRARGLIGSSCKADNAGAEPVRRPPVKVCFT